MHREDAVRLLECLASLLYVAFAPQQRSQVRERNANSWVKVAVGGSLNGQSALVRGAGGGQVACLLENKSEVAELGGNVRMVWSALLLTQCHGTFEQRLRRGYVVLFGEDVAQVGEIGDDGGVVRAEDCRALVEHELKQCAGAVEVTLLE